MRLPQIHRYVGGQMESGTKAEKWTQGTGVDHADGDNRFPPKLHGQFSRLKMVFSARVATTIEYTSLQKSELHSPHGASAQNGHRVKGKPETVKHTEMNAGENIHAWVRQTFPRCKTIAWLT